MAEDRMSKERQEELVERKPTPALRAVQQGITPPVPPEPAQPPPVSADLQKEIDALKARNEGLVKGDKAKDRALEDAKAKLAAAEAKLTAPTPVPEPGTVNTEDVVAEAVRKANQEIAKSLRAELQPLADEGRKMFAERQKAKAVADYGQEAFDKHEQEAETMRQQHPTLSLSQAMGLVVPRSAGPQTAPATPVEGSRPPEPTPAPTEDQAYEKQLERARALQRSGNKVAADKLLKDALKGPATRIFERSARGGL